MLEMTSEHLPNGEIKHIPFIKPGKEIWEYCEEMGEKCGIETETVYSILERKILQLAKLNERGARVIVESGETRIEVGFIKNNGNHSGSNPIV